MNKFKENALYYLKYLKRSSIQEHYPNKLHYKYYQLKYTKEAIFRAFRENYFLKSTFQKTKFTIFGSLAFFAFLVFSQHTDRQFYNKYHLTDQIITFLEQNFSQDARMVPAFHNILDQCLLGDVQQDAQMFVTIGRIYAQQQTPEFAYQAYQIAHLKEPGTFRTNSDLPVDCILKQKAKNVQISNAKNLNDLLDTLSE